MISGRLLFGMVRMGVGCGVIWATGCSTSPVSSHPPDLPQSPGLDPVPVIQVESPSRQLTEIESWMELARRHNPDLVRLRVAVEVADARAQTVEGWRDPELRLGAGRSERVTERTWWASVPEGFPVSGEDPYLSAHSPSTPMSQADRLQVALRFFPPNPLYVSARNAANRASAEIARADFKAAEWRIYCGLKAALTERDGVDRGIALADRLIGTRREMLDATRALVTAGEMTRLDEISARQNVFQTSLQRERLLSRRQTAADELRSLAGFAAPPAGAALRGKPAPLPALDTLDINLLENRALARRSEIISAHWRGRVAAEALREARSMQIPWFSFLEASYGRTLTRDDVGGALWMNSVDPKGENEPAQWFSQDQDTEDEWRLDLGITLPIFSLGPRATRVALAGQRAAGAEEEQIAAQVAGEVRSAFQDYGDQMRRIAAVRQDVQVQEAQILTHQDLSVGNSEFSRFDEARLREAALDLESLINDLEQSGRLAFLRLEAAVGGEL